MAAEVKVGITGDATGLIAALNASKAAVAEATEQMRGAFERVAGAMETINTAMLAVTAVLAGGRAFGEAIQASAGAAYSAFELGRQMGITANQASVLKVAMDDNFVSADAMSSASDKIAKTLKTNEQAFVNLGVATRDSNGNFRNTFDIMQDTNAKLLTFKEGTDRNVEGMKIYGKSWTSMMDAIKITGAAMEEAKAKADALGLTVGSEGVAQSIAYKKSMVDVKTVFEAIEKAVGDKLVPILTQLGEWFSTVGPAAVNLTRTAMTYIGTVFGAVGDSVKAVGSAVMDIFSAIGGAIETVVGNFENFLGAILGIKTGVTGSIGEMFGGHTVSLMEFFVNILRTIESTFILVRGVIQEAAQIIGGGVENLIGLFNLLATVVERAVVLDWKGVQSAWANGTAKLEQQTAERFKNIVDIAKKTATDINDALTKNMGAKGPVTEAPEKKGDKSSGQDPAQLALIEAAFEKEKATWQAKQLMEGSFREYSKEQEVAYWQNILHTVGNNQSIRTELEKKIAAAQQIVQKQSFTDEMATLKDKEAAFKDNLQMQLSLEYEYAAKMRVAYGSDSKEYADAQKSIVQTKLAMVKQQEQADQIRSQTARTAALNEVQANEEAAQLAYDDRRMSLSQLLALQAQFENQRFAIKQEEVQKELAAEALGPDSPVKKAQLDAQLEALETQHQSAMSKIQQKQAVQQESLYKTMTDSMSKSFSTAFASVVNGTQTMGQAFKSLYSSLLSSTLKFIEGWLAKMLMAHLAKMTMSKTEITADAAGAAVSGAKSAAQIPYVGWAMAIGAAASIFAAMAGYSAAGGFDVPSGINPMTQLHSKEMVLPAPLAEKVRGMTETGDTSGDPGEPDVHVSFPGKDLGNHFLMHKDDLLAAIKTLTRNGQLTA